VAKAAPVKLKLVETTRKFPAEPPVKKSATLSANAADPAGVCENPKFDVCHSSLARTILSAYADSEKARPSLGEPPVSESWKVL
jgi:hypothetical protein